MPVKSLLFIVIVTLFTGAASFASAHSYKQGDISIGHIWTPLTDDQSAVNIYGPLLNTGAEGDALVSAQSPLAQTVRFQMEEEGVVKTFGEITLAPGKPVSLASWGLYIRLEELSAPLEAGGSFPLTLVFKKAGEITVDVKVEADAPDH